MSANDEFSVDYINRNTLGDDAQTNTQVVSAFNEAPLFLTYMGHGAEDLWGLDGFFENTDAGCD